MASEVVCVVCLSEDPNLAPIPLENCAHTVCLSCLHGLLHTRSRKCPLCRAKICTRILSRLRAPRASDLGSPRWYYESLLLT